VSQIGTLKEKILASTIELKNNWQSDVLSGFLVFLIALPLCLGIAMASGFPPTSGIITAIIGGILVSRINGSSLTINGPAAGLIVVILSANQTLGQGDATRGFHYTLAAIVVAALIQIAMGLSKAGRLNAYFPSSVVHGMLAARIRITEVDGAPQSLLRSSLNQKDIQFLENSEVAYRTASSKERSFNDER